MGKPTSTTDTAFVQTNLTPVYNEPATVDTVLNQASAAQTVTGNSGPLSVGAYHELAVDVNVTAVSGTSPSMTLNIDRQGADGTWNSIYASSAITAAGVTSTSIGAGLATNASFGGTIRLRWTISGTTPSFTFSASIIGKQAV